MSHSLTYSLSDNLKARDASASKKFRLKSPPWPNLSHNLKTFVYSYQTCKYSYQSCKYFDQSCKYSDQSCKYSDQICKYFDQICKYSDQICEYSDQSFKMIKGLCPNKCHQMAGWLNLRRYRRSQQILGSYQ